MTRVLPSEVRTPTKKSDSSKTEYISKEDMSEATYSISKRRNKRDDSHSAITEPIKDLKNLAPEEQLNLTKNRRIYKYITDDASMSYLKVIEDENKEVEDDDFKKIMEDYDGEIDLRLGAINTETDNDNTDKNITAQTKISTTSKTASAITRLLNITKPTFTTVNFTTSATARSSFASTGTTRRDVKPPYFNSKLLQRYKDSLAVNKQMAKAQETTEKDHTEKNPFIFDENMYSELEELF